MQIRKGGAWRTITSGKVFWGGAWHPIINGKEYFSRNWRDVCNFTAPPPPPPPPPSPSPPPPPPPPPAMTLTPSETILEAQGTGSTITSDPITVTPSGGLSPYSYVCSVTVSDGATYTLSAPNSATTSVTASPFAEIGDTHACTIAWTVTDSLKSTAKSGPVQISFRRIGTIPNPPCVSVDSLILMADGSEKRAGDLVVGDRVETCHELTLERGAFTVSAVNFVDRPIYSRGGWPDATIDHRFCLSLWLARFLPPSLRWFRAGWFGKAAGVSSVAQISVDEARTYFARAPGSPWRLSHNLKQQQL